MSAVVCICGEEAFEIVSAHHNIDAAYDYLDRMRETGEAENWRGTLVVVPGADADVGGVINLKKLLEWLDFRGIKWRREEGDA